MKEFLLTILFLWIDLIRSAAGVVERHDRVDGSGADGCLPAKENSFAQILSENIHLVVPRRQYVNPGTMLA